MSDLYSKVEKPVKGHRWLIILFVIMMLMWAIAEFFEPVWDALMKSIAEK